LKSDFVFATEIKILHMDGLRRNTHAEEVLLYFIIEVLMVVTTKSTVV
jgi:hypothetical protein